MATVSTTFTFSSTDITSDALSFTVSENLSLTGSGGIRRFDLVNATNSQSAYEVINSESFALPPAAAPGPLRAHGHGWRMHHAVLYSIGPGQDCLHDGPPQNM